ncbi:MAG: lactonase family protein, partial [Lachnospiraceae bacterium]|nr:lactonase family protein [Lachnospiraceae bacterium]
GANTVALFDRNDENGLLYQRFVLPVSGDFPKRIVMLPGEQYRLSLNHVSNSVTCFKIIEDKKYMVMNGRSIDVDYPNCCAVVEI